MFSWSPRKARRRFEHVMSVNNRHLMFAVGDRSQQQGISRCVLGGADAERSETTNVRDERTVRFEAAVACLVDTSIWRERPDARIVRLLVSYWSFSAPAK